MISITVISVSPSHRMGGVLWRLAGLWAVLNNVGIAMCGEIDFFPMDEYERAMNVNLFGTIRVTKSVLRLVRKAKGTFFLIICLLAWLID